MKTDRADPAASGRRANSFDLSSRPLQRPMPRWKTDSTFVVPKRDHPKRCPSTVSSRAVARRGVAVARGRLELRRWRGRLVQGVCGGGLAAQDAPDEHKRSSRGGQSDGVQQQRHARSHFFRPSQKDHARPVEDAEGDSREKLAPDPGGDAEQTLLERAAVALARQRAHHLRNAVEDKIQFEHG